MIQNIHFVFKAEQVVELGLRKSGAYMKRRYPARPDTLFWFIRERDYSSLQSSLDLRT